MQRMGTDDRQLLLATAEGDASAFAVFVRRHTAPLLRFCLGRLGDRHAAEDAVQEAMMRLFEQVTRRRIPDAPGAWLFSIARRCCQEQQRTRSKHAAKPLDAEAEPAAADRVEEPTGVAAHVEQLSDAEQALLTMKHAHGLRCREIAEQTGQPTGTVTAALSRIYGKLRVAMTQEAGT
jgi:RNA polymerase sigma-70 factor (ECF subfamily)